MNILSLCFGIAALVFAIHSFQVRGCLTCCTISSFCCSASLLFQLVDNNRIALLEDVSAILDTAHARVVCASVLVVLCTVLNIAALHRNRKQRSCKAC